MAPLRSNGSNTVRASLAEVPAAVVHGLDAAWGIWAQACSGVRKRSCPNVTAPLRR